VEDDLDVVKLLVDDLKQCPHGVALSVATSRDAALLYLEHDSFDLIICDLKIPSSSGGLDIEIGHGEAVQAKSRVACAGTPVAFFTAFETEALLRKWMRANDRCDIFGSGALIPMIDSFRKSHIVDLLQRVNDYAEEISKLDDIEVSDNNTGLNLSEYEKRIIRIFSRRKGGRVVQVSELGGGLSSARVLRTIVQDASLGARAITVAKIAKIEKVKDERKRYQDHVVALVKARGYPPIADSVCAGAAGLGGIFYKLEEEYDQTLFDLLQRNEAVAIKAIEGLRDIVSPWFEGASSREVLVRDIRRDLLSDERLEPIRNRLEDLPLEEFEKRQVVANYCSQHRDLQGLNVLVTSQGRPLLIDFGEVGMAPASIDPITLELGVVFHPKGKDIRGTWPTPEQAKYWADRDRFCAESPFPNYSRKCRDWAFSQGGSDRAVYATAYSYALRQMKYEDTNHPVALAIARSAISAFNTT
jgi:CheY-like chemotaxis protein